MTEVIESDITCVPWSDVSILVNEAFPRPPRDVFYKIIRGLTQQRRIWTAKVDNQLVGMIMLIPNSKGGHIENIVVSKAHRGKGLGKQLVERLISDISMDSPQFISLTTRVPRFFESCGFKIVENFTDGSRVMIKLI